LFVGLNPVAAEEAKPVVNPVWKPVVVLGASGLKPVEKVVFPVVKPVCWVYWGAKVVWNPVFIGADWKGLYCYC